MKTTYRTESTYYIDREEADKRHLKSVKSEMRKFIKDSHIEDLEFVLNVMENLNDWKATFRVLGKDK